LAASDTALFAELGHRDTDTADRTLAISDDGGRTWEEHEGPLPAVVRRSTDEVCRTDGHCFAARGATIESKAPGRGWTEAYGFDATQRELLDYRRSDGGAPLDEIFASAVVAP